MVSFSCLFLSSLMAGAAMAAPVSILQSKQGAAYNDISLVSSIPGVSWAYNWADSAGGTLPSGVEYVPLIWGTQSFSTWNQNVEAALSAGSTHILGFNEPDEPSQANMSPAEAVGYYKQYVTPYANRATLGTPAVTNGGGSMGLSWLSQYLDICAGTCGQQFVAVHWYNDASQTQDFIDHVNSAIGIAKAHDINEVWITEFGVTGGDPVQFLQTVRSTFLDITPEVARYSYFMVSDGSLLSGTALSSLGSAYMAA